MCKERDIKKNKETVAAKMLKFNVVLPNKD